MGFRNPQLGKVLDSERKSSQCDLDVKTSAAISFGGEKERFAAFCSKIDSLTTSAAPPSSQFPPTEESWAMLSYLPPGPFSPPPPPPRTKSRSVVPPPPPPLPARRSIAADVERRRAPLPVSPSLENKHHHPQKISRDKSSQWQTFCRFGLLGLLNVFWKGLSILLALNVEPLTPPSSYMERQIFNTSLKFKEVILFDTLMYVVNFSLLLVDMLPSASRYLWSQRPLLLNIERLHPHYCSSYFKNIFVLCATGYHGSIRLLKKVFNWLSNLFCQTFLLPFTFHYTWGQM